MRFGCETRLPWSPPRTKTSNTTTPKSHENPNSSSVKGGNERRQSRRRFSGEKFGVGFILRNPQQTTAMLGEPANTATASTRSYRHRQSENCCRDTVTHTHIARKVFTAKVCRPRRFERQMALRFAVDVCTICGSAGKHATLAAATSNIVGEEACFFFLEEVIKERPVKKMLPAELKCKISTVVLMKWVSI